MSTSLKHAAEEAGAFLAAFPGLDAGVDVRQLAPWPYPPLTLGTVYALCELARDVVEISDEYSPAELARAITGH